MAGHAVCSNVAWICGVFGGGVGVRYGSVCSGIEAVTVAWSDLGWQAAWFSEIEKFPSQVLQHHYPKIPNLGDMTKIAEMVKSSEVEAPDILVGGTPCQAFSVAGLRNSLEDERGQLSLEFVRLANEIDTARAIRGQQPSIIVWENVPGVLNTKDNAFGCFLGALSGAGCELQPTGRKWPNAGCVYGPQRQIAWRILDAQYFGLAQRRKRVFVIASARTECVAEILFERKSVFGNIAQSKSEGKGSAKHGAENIRAASNTVSRKLSHAIGVGGITANAGMNNELMPTLLVRKEADGYVIQSFGIQGNIIGRSINAGGNGIGFKEEQAPTLTAADTHGVVVHGTQDPIYSSDTAHCLGRNSGQENVLVCSFARYLTEIECERLQGFPDNYTNIPKSSKSSRYKALGNSMAVPVMRWIGERIKRVGAFS